MCIRTVDDSIRFETLTDVGTFALNEQAGNSNTAVSKATIVFFIVFPFYAAYILDIPDYL